MIRDASIRRPISFFMIVTLLCVTLSPVSAFADIAGTSNVIAEASATTDRTNLLEQLNREDVRDQLARMGVNAQDAIERVAAMTDTEVAALTEGLSAYPAGGDGGIVVVVLLVILVVLLMR